MRSEGQGQRWCAQSGRVMAGLHDANVAGDTRPQAADGWRSPDQHRMTPVAWFGRGSSGIRLSRGMAAHRLAVMGHASNGMQRAGIYITGTL